MNARMKMLIATAALVAAVAHPSIAAAHTQYQSRLIIRTETGRAGFTYWDIKAMETLAYRESTWRDRATNGYCYGLFQLSRPMIIGYPWWDPTWNTRRALRYVKGRYGTPRRALAHSYRYGWY